MRDAIVIGAGPNGLAAAVVLARAGLSVSVIEAADTPGGGSRTSEVTAPGFLHDICASVHPMAVASPIFQELALEELGVEWVHPDVPVAHAFAPDRMVMLERSIGTTAEALGADGRAYRELFTPLVEQFDELIPSLLAPLAMPKSPLKFARFGLQAIRSLRGIARRFRDREAPALLAGIAAHAMLPLEATASAAVALVLGAAAHRIGWPIARGGSQTIIGALVTRLVEAGGDLELGRRISSMADLPPARAYVFDVSPRQLVAIAGDRLPPGYRRALSAYRYGPAACKVDWALRGPIPWRDPQALRAGTVHLGGTLDDIAHAEADVHAGRVPARPYILLAQPTLIDPSRAPANQHVAWAYCHVPADDPTDMTAAIEAEIERHAPGFRDQILARATLTAPQLAAYNENYVGGHILGGIADVRQLLARPLPRLDPYSTPARDIFLCSASTPPGPGVHGMCGYHAARRVLAKRFSGA